MASVSTYHGPRYTDFVTLDSRIQSFSSCSNTDLNPCHEYAKAGFFAVGDKLICFYCGIVLSNIKKYDNPWIEHLIYGSRCAYLRIVRTAAHESEEKEWSPCSSKNIYSNYETRELLPI